MSEYLKREDVRRAVLHNEGDAVIAAIDALEPVKITHCGECDYYEPLDDFSKFGYCISASYAHYGPEWEYSVKRTVKADYFCGDAVPVEEGLRR